MHNIILLYYLRQRSWMELMFPPVPVGQSAGLLKKLRMDLDETYTNDSLRETE